MKTPIHLTVNYSVNGKNVTHSFVTEFEADATKNATQEEQLPEFVSTIVSGIKAKTQSSTCAQQ